MKVLLLGPTGQVGREVLRLLQASDFTVQALLRQDCDFTQTETLQEHVLAAEADWIINCAAFTAVDKAEEQVALAYAINAEAVATIAAAALSTQAKVIHLSTDYVFAGDKASPYTPVDTTQPRSVYGASKLLGEQVLQETLAEHLILRLSWIFSPHGSNFVKTLCRLLTTKKSVRVVADQYGCPSAAANIAQVIYRLLCHNTSAKTACWGTYHYADTPRCTWFDFAMAIREQLLAHQTAVAELIPIKTTEYVTKAQRPSYSVLDCAKINEDFNIEQLSWLPELIKTLKAVMAPGLS